MGNGDCYRVDQVVSAMKMTIFAQHCQNNISSGTDFSMVLNVASDFDITAVQKAKHTQSKKASTQTPHERAGGSNSHIEEWYNRCRFLHSPGDGED